MRFGNSLWIALGVIIASPAMAEKEVGNGGHAVVCRNNDGTIRSATLYDFWEAENVRSPRVKIERSMDLYLDQVLAAVKRLKSELHDSEFAEQVTHELDLIDSHLNPTRGVRLKFTDDLGEVAYPSDCPIEQLANYTEDQDYSILRSEEIWAVLPETDKAAWYLHEAIYRVYRKFGDKTSEKTRKAVAYLFSAHPLATGFVLPSGVQALCAEWGQIKVRIAEGNLTADERKHLRSQIEDLSLRMENKMSALDPINDLEETQTLRACIFSLELWKSKISLASNAQSWNADNPAHTATAAILRILGQHSSSFQASSNLRLRDLRNLQGHQDAQMLASMLDRYFRHPQICRARPKRSDAVALLASYLMQGGHTVPWLANRIDELYDFWGESGYPAGRH